MKPRIVIELDGGLVQNVVSNIPVEVLVVDRDIEAVDPEDIKDIPDTEGDPQMAFSREEAPIVNPDLVDQMWWAAIQ